MHRAKEEIPRFPRKAGHHCKLQLAFETGLVRGAFSVLREDAFHFPVRVRFDILSVLLKLQYKETRERVIGKH
jgi:hypothetical protein